MPIPAQHGRIVSHLRELLVANDLSSLELARRAGLHVRNHLVQRLARDTVLDDKVYKFDILARICALFGDLPLEILLEYVPPGEEPTPRFLKREVLEALPTSYGWIRCWLKERAADAMPTLTYPQMVAGLGVHRDTASHLANYRAGGVSARVLAALSARFGGVERVFTYDPHMENPAHPSLSLLQPVGQAEASSAGEGSLA